MTSPSSTTPAPLHNQTLPQGGRVLVVRLSALGDLLFALETVSTLATLRPDLQIEFLVEDRFAAILRDHPQLAAVHVYPRRNKWRILPSLLRLRRRRFDAILDLHGILKSAIQVRLLAAGTRVGFGPPGSREGSHRAYDIVVPMPEPLPHRADMGLQMLAHLGLPSDGCAPRLAIDPAPKELFGSLPRPLVLLHPGTSTFATFKRWPPARFAELARRLAANGLGVAVSHGPGEDALAREILDKAPLARGVDGGRLGLLGMAGALQAADVVVAADTGPLHIAAAVGTPCVAIFGPKNPDRYGPRAHGGLEHEIVFHDVPCRPCRRRDCAAPLCVLGVTVDTVEAAVHRLCKTASGAAW